MVDFLYTGDYSEVFDDRPKDSPKRRSKKRLLQITAPRLHTKMFFLGDKYGIQELCDLAVQKYSNTTQAKFDAIEYLDSIPDVFSSPSKTSNALRQGAIHAFKENLGGHLQNESVREKYESIITEVPEFTIGLLDALWEPAPPPVYNCHTCEDVPMSSFNRFCGNCGSRCRRLLR